MVSYSPTERGGEPENVVTATELEKMSPAERHALFEASIVTNLDDAPQHLVERARARAERLIAESESQPG
jgi:hypothetical protein